MKRIQKGYSRNIRASFVRILKWCFFLFCLVFFGVTNASAQSLSRFETTQTGSGKVIEFLEGEYLMLRDPEATEAEWQIKITPNIDFKNQSGQTFEGFRSLTGRFYFDRKNIDDTLSAIHLIGIRGNFSVTLNGFELFRNFANASDQKNAWYRPFLISIPEAAFVSGKNEILIHSFTRKSPGIGRVFVGSNSVLQTYQQSKYFWHITAPRSANMTMLIMGILVFFFWLARKSEIELFWFTISAVLFYLRNHQYYTENIPINFRIYSDITVSANFFSILVFTAFYFNYVKLPNRNKIILLMFFITLPVILHFFFFTNSSLLLYLTSASIMSVVAFVAIKDVLSNHNIERGVVGIGVLLLPFASLHDIIMLIRYSGDGHATYYAVFCGAIYTTTFFISFGKRVLGALNDLGESQLVLEQRIADTRAELIESEAKRQELLVTQAMTSERARLMQEMHDGIGSNLTTALAVARQQNQPVKTITVLSRALGDLKLTVDSLEPVDGDIVVLLGNLRHRMARDLTDAGITCVWEVEECALLKWLDAPNALHVLRIYNEAISNILTHSDASEIRIGCIEAEQNGIVGISTYITDNGNGFDIGLETQGKGLVNIKARAQSLHGQLSYKSQPGIGTTVQLWLPYNREVD